MHFYTLKDRQRLKTIPLEGENLGFNAMINFDRIVQVRQLDFITLTYLLSKVGGYFSAVSSLAILIITPFLFWNFRKSLGPNCREI